MASDDDINVKFTADTGAFSGGAQDVQQHLVDVGAEVTRAEELFRYLGERMLEVFALHEITEFVGKMGELGEQLERMSAMTGISTDTLQTFQFAIARTGGNAESAGLMMTRFERYIEEAASGTGMAYQAFHQLGISLQELKTLSIDELMTRTAQALRDVADPVERAAIASQIGGRGFAQMLPALLQGAEGMQKFKERLTELNDNLSENTIKALAETKEKLTDLGYAAQGAGVQAMLLFKGSIDGLIEAFTNAFIAIGRVIELFRHLGIVVSVDVVEGFAYLKHEVERVGDELWYYAERIEIKWEEAARVIRDALTRNWSDIATAETVAQAKIDQANRNLAAGLQIADGRYKDLTKSAKQAGEAMWDAYNAGSGEKSAGAANRTGLSSSGGADQAKLASIAAEEGIAKAHLATTIALLQQEQVYHQITKQQEVEEEKKTADAEYAIELKALQEKRALYEQGTADYAKANAQIEVLAAQHTAKIAQLDVKMAQANQQAAQQSYKSWLGVLQPINTAFDGMLQGILSGTETLSQAMASAFENMAVSVVESILKIIAEWLVFEAVTEGQGTWADFVAIQGGQSGGGGGFLGGVGKILGFDVGTPYVPQTGLAMIHQGEMIIPAAQSDAIRSGQASLGGGSNVSVNMNVNAVDAKSFMSIVNQPNILRQLAKNIGGYLNNNPSARAAY